MNDDEERKPAADGPEEGAGREPGGDAPAPVGGAGSDADAAGPEQASDPAGQLAALEERVASLEDERLRALADVENMRRRSIRERQEADRYGAARLATDLLAVADNLRRALASVDDDARAGNEALGTLLTGVEMVEQELAGTLSRHRVIRIEALGERFDHTRHEAMFEVETAESEPGTVVQVVQDGYILHERLLRPALVGVAKAPAEPAGVPARPESDGGERPTRQG